MGMAKKLADRFRNLRLNHANAVLAILQNAPAHIRALWEQYAVQFRATNMRRDEGAFYSPRDDSVHLHIPSVARGDAISPCCCRG